MAEFDPDAYMRERGLVPPEATPGFDPDAYLKARGITLPEGATGSDDPFERAAARVKGGVKGKAKIPLPGLTEGEKRAEAFAFGGGNAATFGMMNRGLGLADYLTGGSPSYGAGVDKVAAHEEEVRKAYPGYHIGGSVVGGVGTGVGLARSGLGFSRDGAGLLQRIGMGAAEGAGYGAASGAGQTYSGEAGDYAKNAIIGGAFGFGGGAIGEGLGTAAGSGWAALRDARQGAFPAPLVRAARADAEGLATLPQRLGADAMLPDAGPSMQAAAQAAALGLGPNRTAIVHALTERDRGTVPRLQADMDRAIGPAPRVSQVEEGIDAGRRQINTEYPPVLQGRAIEPGEANRVLGRINDMALSTRTNLDEVVGALTVPGHNLPDLSPQAWLSARQRVDSMIEAASNPMNPDRYRASVLTQVRQMIDDELAANVPGVKAVDAKFAANRAEQDALQTGRNVLDTGKEAVHPEDLRGLLQTGATPQGLAPPGPPAANLRLRQGARAEIDRRVGTHANDLNTLETTMGTPQDWNAQKLSQIFGPEAAQAVRDSVARNRQYRETYQRVVQGSDTAQRKAAAETSDLATMPVPTRNVAGTIEQVGRWGLGQAIEAQKQAQREAMARILAARDPAEVERLRQGLLGHIRGTAPGVLRANRNVRGGAQGAGMLLDPAYEDYTR